MITTKKTLCIAAAAATLVGCTGNNNRTPQLDNMADTLSWVMGENVGRTLQEGNLIDLDNEVFLQAVRHTLEGREQPIDEQTYSQTLQFIMQMAALKQMQEAKDLGTNADAAQEEYFAQLVANNPKVRRHEAGFYYEVLKDGHGRKAKYGDNVSFDYRSFLMLTGEPLDQTYGQRDPIMHVIGKPMFPGLVEGMQLMNAGSIYRFYFPYKLAFGEAGTSDVPPFTPMIYEVELHEFI